MYAPLISVIIPVYNTQAYLDRCLESITQNTYSNTEIICINDGSTDESLQTLEKWANRDCRIRIFTIPHSGLSKARNVGMRYAKGELVGFIDSDDWVHRQYFELLLKGVINYNADISVCERIITERFPIQENEFKQSNYILFNAETFTKNKYVKTYVWGRLYKRELLTKFNEKLTVEDKPFNFEVMYNNPKIVIGYTKSVGYYYFVREDSLVHTITEDDWFQMAVYYLGCLKRNIDANNEFGVRLYFDDAIKHTLSSRYLAESDVIWVRKKEWITKKAIFLIAKSGSAVSKKKKVFYNILLRLPETYSAFRKVADSELLLELKRRVKITGTASGKIICFIVKLYQNILPLGILSSGGKE